ncbi:putative metalloprotease CJM1_0395 family protein [Marinobacterium lacunae]|nr:putative metalloprotease CJM1_0395 family protein [Marinobacterium lacunae]
MITAISSYTAYTSQLPSNRGAEAANVDERDRAQRNSTPADATSSQSSSQSSTQNDTGSGLRGEKRVNGTQRSSDVDQQLIDELAVRDREVRAHEQAHQAAGGGLAGSASFTYERGPNGKQYAVGGEVSIAAPVSSDDPQADLEKAQIILRAALAPADPSGQDLKVAAAARALATNAQVGLATQGSEESENSANRQEAASERQSDVEVAQQAESVQPRTSELQQELPLASGDANTESQVEEFSPSVIERYEQRQAESEERRAALEEEQRAHEQRAEQLAEYQQEMAQIQQRLAEINKKFANAGALDIPYPVGSFINDQA